MNYDDFEDRTAFGMTDWVLRKGRDDRFFSEKELKRGVEFLTEVPQRGRPTAGPAGGSGADSSANAPAPVQAEAAAEGPASTTPVYGVLMSRKRVAQVGRIAVLRSHRGKGQRIGENLIGLAVEHMLRRGIAAVFLDCSSHHVQRYQSMGFIEYKPPYMHRHTGARYHTLVAMLGTMGTRRQELWRRTQAWFPAAWMRLPDVALGPMRPGMSEMSPVDEAYRRFAWTFLFFEARRDSAPYALSDAFEELCTPTPGGGGVPTVGGTAEPGAGSPPSEEAAPPQCTMAVALGRLARRLESTRLAFGRLGCDEFREEWAATVLFALRAAEMADRLDNTARDEFLGRGLDRALEAERAREAAGKGLSEQEHGLLAWSFLAPVLRMLLEMTADLHRETGKQALDVAVAQIAPGREEGESFDAWSFRLEADSEGWCQSVQGFAERIQQELGEIADALDPQPQPPLQSVESPATNPRIDQHRA